MSALLNIKSVQGYAIVQRAVFSLGIQIDTDAKSLLISDCCWFDSTRGVERRIIPQEFVSVYGRLRIRKYAS